MMQRLWVALIACCVATMSSAGEWTRIGYGHLVTNDELGDGYDRWRTGSAVGSLAFARSEWQGTLPAKFGDLIEVRLHGEVVSPERIVFPAPGDRPYAAVLSLGLHSHYQTSGTDISVGADVIMTGTQTGLDDFQRWLHGVLNAAKPSALTLGAQVANDIHGQVVVEMAHPLDLGSKGELRPFVEGRYGFEDLIRVGLDLRLGDLGASDLMVRETVTGHRYRVTQSGPAGLGLVFGGDIATIGGSAMFPSTSSVTVSEVRKRLRAGVQWQTKKGLAGFYGVTWLSPEFQGQNEGQLVGSIGLSLKF